MYDKLKSFPKDTPFDERLTNNLFHEFENPMGLTQKTNSKNFKKNVIHNAINISVEHILDDLVINVIDDESLLLNSKNVKEVVMSIKDFLTNSNVCTFEYTQKTGRNIMKIEHVMGINGSSFYKKFFEKIFVLFEKLFILCYL